MFQEKTIGCVIPARLNSVRFPKKMLQNFAGKPLLQWVWEAAKRVSLFDHLVIAVDSKEVEELVASFGARSCMTSPLCESGTDRLIEVKRKGIIDPQIWVNWQGDEPFIEESTIVDLLSSIDGEGDVWTLKKWIEDEREIDDPTCVKVVTDVHDKALYFSRSPIPHVRSGGGVRGEFYRHIGIYAYTGEALDRIGSFEPCALEKAEKLEQLRFLYNGLKIIVNKTDKEIFGIDLPDHLIMAEKKILSALV